MVTIVYFCGGRSADVDNVPKPILDVLKGLVFRDDDQVTDLICRKRNLASFQVGSSGSRVLDGGLSKGQDFVFISVTEAPNPEVIF